MPNKNNKNSKSAATTTTKKVAASSGEIRGAAVGSAVVEAPEQPVQPAKPANSKYKVMAYNPTIHVNRLEGGGETRGRVYTGGVGYRLNTGSDLFGVVTFQGDFFVVDLDDYENLNSREDLENVISSVGKPFEVIGEYDEEKDSPAALASATRRIAGTVRKKA